MIKLTRDDIISQVNNNDTTCFEVFFANGYDILTSSGVFPASDVHRNKERKKQAGCGNYFVMHDMTLCNIT